MTINDLSTLGFFSFAVFGRAPVFSISTEINDRSPGCQGTWRKRSRPQSCLSTMPTRLLYLFLDMLGILSLKNKSITFCFLMTLLRLGALGQKWRTHCQKIWFFVVRIVYKPKTKCASAIGRNKPTASLTTTQLHWKTNPWSIDHTAVLVYAKCLFNTQEIQNNTLPFVCLTCS